MRSFVTGIVCLLFSCVPAAADDWLKALMLFDAGRYEEALELAAPFAEADNLLAQEMLYASYTYGYGVPVDHVKALAWLQRSADLGDVEAQMAMGMHFFDGVGVAPDYSEAMRWFRLAAQQGHGGAVFNLGKMTMNGQGVEADPQEAWRLVQFAAELDDPGALHMVGATLLQNFAETGEINVAVDYLERAALLGHGQAGALMGFILEDLPENPDNLIKSAFYYRTAIVAGCDDLADEAAKAVARLSPSEIKMLEHNLALWRPDTDPRDPQPELGHCLAG